MKKFVIISILGLFVLSVSIGLFSYNFKASAQNNYVAKWEYGTITKIYYLKPERNKINKIVGIVEFCELTNSGCERREITHELDYPKYLKDAELQETYEARILASQKASEIAFQKALSRLGSTGWEMIGEPNLEFTSVDLYRYERFEDKTILFTRKDTVGLYFKRIKSR